MSEGERFTHRADPAVPAFADAGPVIFIDGSCGFCSAGARTIARLDRRDRFLICPAQSATGRAVLRHHGLDAEDPDSWLYLEDGRAYTSLDALIRVAARLGGPGHALRLLRVLPRPVRDWLYRRVARNRYSLMGRTDICAIPDERLRRKLIS